MMQYLSYYCKTHIKVNKKAPFGAFVFYAWSTNFFSSSALLIMSVVLGKSGMVGNERVSRLASVSLE
jgi:hypothetical protein